MYYISNFKKGSTLNKDYIFNRMKGNPQYGLFVPDNAERTKEIIEKFSFFISKTILLNILAYFQCGQKFVSRTKCDFKIKALRKEKRKMESVYS